MQTTPITVYRVDYSDQIGFYIQTHEANLFASSYYEDGWRDSELDAIEAWRALGKKDARDLRALADAIEIMAERATPKVWSDPIMAPILGEV